MIKALEWAEFTLMSILLVRFIAVVTNNDNADLFEKTEREAKKATNFIMAGSRFRRFL